MLTFRRFRAMAASYGGDLRRWPEALRPQAEALRDASPEARALLDEALRLDDAIEKARTREDAALLPTDESGAALARLRSSVAAAIASSAPGDPKNRRFARPLAFSLSLRWVGMASGGAFAVTAGLFLGAIYATGPAPDAVQMLLQPAPIEFLVE
ncbi:MAG TPA: hypothetical protein VLX85_10120 [Stellaceae bacterium]|nr:hypothetical protein [Stellaceae bacterium]